MYACARVCMHVRLCMLAYVRALACALERGSLMCACACAHVLICIRESVCARLLVLVHLGPACTLVRLFTYVCMCLVRL